MGAISCNLPENAVFSLFSDKIPLAILCKLGYNERGWILRVCGCKPMPVAGKAVHVTRPKRR